MIRCPSEAVQKLCKVCGVTKALEEFYRHPNGAFERQEKCKECAKRLSREHRNRNLERYREYDKQRWNDPGRKERVYASFKRNRLKDPERYNGYGKSYIERNPIIRKAHCAVWSAIKSGKLVVQPCEQWVVGQFEIRGAT